MCKNYDSSKIKPETLEFFQQGVEIEPKKNQRKVRDEEKQKE